MSTLDRWYAMKQERDTLRRAQRNLTNSYNALSQQLAEVRTELASHAWTVSPAMADAQIHQLNLKIIGLEETIAIHTACATALKQQLAQACDEARTAKWYARKLAEAEYERDKLRSIRLSLKAACDSAALMIDSLEQQLADMTPRVQRLPTETETVCGQCGGHGWSERGY